MIAEVLIGIFAFIMRVVASLFSYSLFLPVCFIIVTPYLLVAALFSEESYPEAIKSGYYNVYLFWKNFICAVWPI